MLVLIRDRKGMTAIVDALIFLSVLSIAAVGMFACSALEDYEDTMARAVSDDLYSTELRLCDVNDSSDTSVYPISTLIAVSLIDGDTESVECIIKRTLNSLVPETHGYSLTITYCDRTLTIQRYGYEEADSSYTAYFDIADTGELISELTIY